jgi:hypothetical protein
MKRRIILLFVFCILFTNIVLADSGVNSTNGTTKGVVGNIEPNEKHILTISPYTLAQLPPIFYGETDLPVGEELALKICKFPTNEEIVSTTVSVLDKNEETKPFFTTPTEGMNKWFFIGNIDDFSFGTYRVNISTMNEGISDENIFRIK